MSELTYISATQIANYSNVEDLKVNIIKTLARWFPNSYVFNEDALESWENQWGTDVDVLYSDTFQFELSTRSENVYNLVMYAIGRYRRNGLSCDFFERVLDCLEYQLGQPDIEFVTMETARSNKLQDEQEYYPETSLWFTHSRSPLPIAGELAKTVVYDEEEDVESEEDLEEVLEEDYRSISYYKSTGFIPPDGVDSGKKTTFEDDDDEDSDHEESDDEESDDEDSDDEDSDDDYDLIMNTPLSHMNDAQIEKYVELCGRCPRDECNEWEMVYNGGDILRYSYCKFIQWGIEDQTVSNITISRATFDEINFENCVFVNVKFEECVFNDIILNNTTFKNCKFIDCMMDSSIVPDDSCELMNYDDSDEDA